MIAEQGTLFLNESLATDISSPAIQFDNVDTMSIQSIFTGSCVGTFFIECSNDLVSSGSDVVNWQLYNSSQVSVTGSGKVLLIINDAIKWYRLSYTRTSGVGTITSNFYSLVNK